MKKAYHRLQLTDGTLVPLVVVEFDDHDNVISWHQMDHEEASVEWVGGTYTL